MRVQHIHMSFVRSAARPMQVSVERSGQRDTTALFFCLSATRVVIDCTEFFSVSKHRQRKLANKRSARTEIIKNVLAGIAQNNYVSVWIVFVWIVLFGLLLFGLFLFGLFLFGLFLFGLFCLDC